MIVLASTGKVLVRWNIKELPEGTIVALIQDETSSFPSRRTKCTKCS